MFLVADQLYANGYDVLKFDEDEVAAGIGAAAGSGVPYDEIENTVNHRLVSDIALLGYSQGGGSVFHLSRYMETKNGFGDIGAYNLPFTTYVDAVHDDGFGQESRLPVDTEWHLNLYQDGTNDPDNVLDLDGTSVDGSNEDFFVETSVVVSVPNATHFDIDHDSDVIDWIIMRYGQNVGR